MDRPLAKMIAGQLRRPSRPVGPVAGAVLDRGNRRINRTAVELLNLERRHEVLEIGFGGGSALARLLELTDRRVAGLELSQAMLRRASRRFRGALADGRLELRQGDVSALPYPEATFDRVLTVQTIHFWPSPEQGMREVLRVLRPGGRFVLAKATTEEMQKRAFTRYGFHFFSDQELRELFVCAAFCDISVKRCGPSVFGIGHRKQG